MFEPFFRIFFRHPGFKNDPRAPELASYLNGIVISFIVRMVFLFALQSILIRSLHSKNFSLVSIILISLYMIFEVANIKTKYERAVAAFETRSKFEERTSGTSKSIEKRLDELTEMVEQLQSK
jgi:hypothetical protein